MRHFRTVFVSDVHLGTKACRADLLLDFLEGVECDELYLVGDIIDFWGLRRSWYWSPVHNDVIQRVLHMASEGTNVVYVAGNHDEAVRDFVPMRFGNLRVVRRAVHRTADGRELLVIHGDEFDKLLDYAGLILFLGGWAYRLVLWVSRAIDHVRRRLGYESWSLSAVLLQNAKRAVGYLRRFRRLVADEARRLGLDGVVCGHVHRPEILDVEGVLYCNDGDWVESCTALVEHEDGTLEVVRAPGLRGRMGDHAIGARPDRALADRGRPAAPARAP